MNKLVLIVSTNSLVIGALVILAGIYGAARWYLNVELGWFAWVVAIGLGVIVNTWILPKRIPVDRAKQTRLGISETFDVDVLQREVQATLMRMA